MRPLFEVYVTREFLRKSVQESNDETVIDFQKQFLLKFTNAQFFVEGFTTHQEFESFLFKLGLSTNEVFTTAQLLDFPKEFSKESFFKKGSPHKLFLLESGIFTEYEDRYGYLFITHEDLATKWVPHRTDMEKEFLVDNERPLPGFESQQFRQWSQLLENCRAGNSMVLFDKYILKNRRTYEQNIAGLLQAVGRACTGEGLNVLIIIEAIDKKEFRELSGEEILKSEKELSTLLDQAGIKNVKVAFVLYPRIGHFPGLYQKNAEHDRFLFTNYFFVESSAGFSLFKSRNSFQHRTIVRVNSLLNRKKIGGAYSAIRSIANYVNSIQATVKGDHHPDVVFCSGPIEQPLIDFGH